MNEKYNSLIQKHIDILSFRDLSEGTIANYTAYLTEFLEWCGSELNGKEPEDVTYEELRSYVKHLQKNRELNNRTINCHIAQLRDFWSYVLHKDFNRYELPFLKYDQYLPKVPTREEMFSIINWFDNPKHRAEIALLYSSGVRVSELCRLRCGDIKVSKKCIYVSRSKNRSDRFAILSDRAYQDLVKYARSDLRGATQDDWLFPGQKTGSHICSQSVANVLKESLIATDLSGKGFNLHSLRHAFGLHLYESGTDIVSIKEAMGHKSLSSTEVYLTLGIGSGRSVKSPYAL